MPNIRPLNHSSACCGLAKGDFIYNSVFFENGATLDAKAISGCGIVFNDGASAISAYNLVMSEYDLRAVDDIVPYHLSRDPASE